MRIRHNYDREEDFVTQTNMLSNRFQEKGYKKQERTRDKVRDMNRDNLLVLK